MRADTNVFNPGLGCYGFDVSLEAGGNVLASGNNDCNQLTVGSFTELTFGLTAAALISGAWFGKTRTASRR